MFTADISELVTLTNTVGAMAARAFNYNALLGDAGHVMVTQDVAERFAAQGPGWAPKGRFGLPGRILDISGRFKKSQGYKVIGDMVVIGTGVPYGRTHQQNPPLKTIRPSGTHGNYMAVPMPSLSKSEYRLSPHWFANTFVRPAKSGKGFVMYQRIGKNRIRPIFWLTKRVNPIARPFLAWEPVRLSSLSDRMLYFIFEGDFPPPVGIKPSHGGWFDTALGWAA